MKTVFKCFVASALSLTLLNLVLGGAMFLRIDPTVRQGSPLGEPQSFHGILQLSVAGIAAWILLVGIWATCLVGWLSRWANAIWRVSPYLVVLLLAVAELLSLLVLHPNLLLLVLPPSYGGKLYAFVESTDGLLADIYLRSGLTRHLGAVILAQLSAALAILGATWSKHPTTSRERKLEGRRD